MKINLTSEDWYSIKSRYISGYTSKELSLEYNVSPSTILNILKKLNVKRRSSQEALKEYNLKKKKDASKKLPNLKDFKRYYKRFSSLIQKYYLGKYSKLILDISNNEV